VLARAALVPSPSLPWDFQNSIMPAMLCCHNNKGEAAFASASETTPRPESLSKLNACGSLQARAIWSSHKSKKRRASAASAFVSSSLCFMVATIIGLAAIIDQGE
jgi:hypothetical protein